MLKLDRDYLPTQLLGIDESLLWMTTYWDCLIETLRAKFEDFDRTQMH